MLFNITRVGCKGDCECDENSNWLAPKSSLDKIENPSPNKAYILPDNTVYVLDYEGKELIPLANNSDKLDLESLTDDLTITTEGSKATFDISERLKTIVIGFSWNADGVAFTLQGDTTSYNLKAGYVVDGATTIWSDGDYDEEANTTTYKLEVTGEIKEAIEKSDFYFAKLIHQENEAQESVRKVELYNSDARVTNPQDPRYIKGLPEPYELAVATPDTVGGVKIGEGLEISSDGTLSAKPFATVSSKFKLLSIQYDYTNKRAYIAFTAKEDVSVNTTYIQDQGAITGQWDEIENNIETSSSNSDIQYAVVDLTILYGRSDRYLKYLVKFTVSNDSTVYLDQYIETYNKTFESLIVPPIGTIITNSQSTFNPEDVYPNTKWKRIKGRMIMAVDEDDIDFATAGKTGGEKSHILDVSANKTKNEVGFVKTRLDTPVGNYGLDSSSSAFNGRIAVSLEGQNETSKANAHNNLPPYITEYVWERNG